MSLNIDRSHSSPNHSSRDGHPITLLVGHGTVGPYAAALSWLCNPNSRVSANYLIRKDGHVDQLMDDSLAAWHAGKSFWSDMDSQEIQKASLGVELENLTGMRMPDGLIHPPDPYPPAQVAAFRELVRLKMAEYHFPVSRVVRHMDIAMPRGRKTDPANFDWSAFIRSLTGALPGTYYVRGCAIHQGPGLHFPIALDGTAFLPSGQLIEIDEIKAEWNGWGKTKDNRGFMLIEQLSRMT